MSKNLDKLLSTLERGPLPYSELQQRSTIPEGSFSRVVGRAIQSGQIVNQDGKYRLSRAPYGINHTVTVVGDGHVDESEASTDGLTITDDSSDTALDESDVRETLPKSIFRVGKRKSTTADTLTVAITREDGTIENISHAEHQRRKGYPGVMP